MPLLPFRLEQWNPTIKRYEQVKDDVTPKGLRDLAHHTRIKSFRIVDKQRRKPLLAKPELWKPRRNYKEVRDVGELAVDVAKFLLARGPGEVKVFPAGKTERNTSNQFREQLAFRLVKGLDLEEKGNVRNFAHPRAYWEWLCSQHGYPFVAIDATDYI